jgi:transposase
MTKLDEAVVGIDVSKLKLDVALLVQGKVKNKVVPNAPAGYRQLGKWLEERGVRIAGLAVCMEATGPYSEPAALGLIDLGMQVSIVNPARVKGFAQSELVRNKNDQVDAALLARFGALMQPEPWIAPPLAYRQLRAKVDRLNALQDMQQQETNRLETYRLAKNEAMIESAERHVGWLEDEIKELQQSIKDHIDGHPALANDAELMKSIPGLGDTSVAKVLAYAGDVRRFESAKALASYAGLTPRQRQSGTSVKGRTMMSRTGHRELRTALYMPGLVAKRHNPTLQKFADKLRVGGLAKKAVMGAVMRKLVHLIYGVITSGKPFDPNWGRPRLDTQDGI